MCSFFISRVFTLLVDMAIMFVFVTLANFDDKIFKLISQVFVIILNYNFNKELRSVTHCLHQIILLLPK